MKKKNVFQCFIILTVFSTCLNAQISKKSKFFRWNWGIDLNYNNKAEGRISVGEKEFVYHKMGLSGSIYVHYLLNKSENIIGHYIGMGLTIPTFMNSRTGFLSRYDQGENMFWENSKEYGFVIPYISFKEKIKLRKNWSVSVGGRFMFFLPGSFTYSLVTDSIEVLKLEAESGENIIYPEINIRISKLYSIGRSNLEFSLGYNYSFRSHLDGTIIYEDISSVKHFSRYQIKNSGITLGLEYSIN